MTDPAREISPFGFIGFGSKEAQLEKNFRPIIEDAEEVDLPKASRLPEPIFSSNKKTGNSEQPVLTLPQSTDSNLTLQTQQETLSEMNSEKQFQPPATPQIPSFPTEEKTTPQES